jgi:predicted PurR-regulated permease PerM
MIVEARPIRLSTTGKVITIAIIVALAILTVRAMGSVVMPFVAATITAYLFNPLITWLHATTRLGRGLWILVLYIVIGALFYMLFRFLGPIVGRQYNELIAIGPGMINQLQQQLLLKETFLIGDIPVNTAPVSASLRDLLAEIGRRLPEQVPHLFATAFETALLFVSYLMLTFYMLLQADRMMEWIYGLVPAPYREEIRGLGAQVDNILAGYIRGTLLLIPIMSALTYVSLSLMGIRYALVLAIFSGIVEVIPLIGPWTAAATAIVVTLFQTPTPFDWPHWLVALVIGLIYLGLRLGEDNFIIPNVVGPAVHLHPMLVIFAILTGGALGGAFGLFVSIPVAAVIKLLLRYFYFKLIDQDPPPLHDARLEPPEESLVAAAAEPTLDRQPAHD